MLVANFLFRNFTWPSITSLLLILKVKYIVCEFFSQLQFFVLDVCLLQVETILDKETFMLEELLDEDEIIQECKALNGRLINL